MSRASKSASGTSSCSLQDQNTSAAGIRRQTSSRGPEETDSIRNSNLVPESSQPRQFGPATDDEQVDVVANHL